MRTTMIVLMERPFTA
ncbi:MULTISPECIES: hypothetical protein [Caulobacter]